MAQQTAVEWLIEKIHKNMGVWIPPHIQEQAKAIMKEQIIESYCKGDDNIGAEQYYNETYGGKDL